MALLIILDGLGYNPQSPSNAWVKADCPNLKKVFSSPYFTTIHASSEWVGLPKGVTGNSEVGHLSLGAGRDIPQDLVRINEVVKNNDWEHLVGIKTLIEKVQNSPEKRLHLMGLLSDGGVHSHIEHFISIISFLKKYPINIIFHAFLDGRDTPPRSAKTYLTQFESRTGLKIASLQGRYFAMDRDRRWDRIQKAYDTLIGKGEKYHNTSNDYLSQQYESGKSDEFISPTLLDDKGAIEDGANILFLNFRPDRTKELSLALNKPQATFTHFPTPHKASYFLCMTPYFEPEEITLPVLFEKPKIPNTWPIFLSQQKKKQFKIAETEKYAHITYFFNGGNEAILWGEDRILIDSPRDIATYDQKPEMSAYLVTDHLVSALKKKQHDFYLVNFANPDMVGHTGNFEAAVKAIEHIDACLKKILDAALASNVPVIITADHGNCDQMLYEDGSPHTAHTAEEVPFAIISNFEFTKQPGEFALKDVVPTIAHIMELKLPDVFTGKPIFLRKS